MGEKISEAAGNLEEAAGCFEELIGYLVAAKGEEKNEEEKTFIIRCVGRNNCVDTLCLRQ